MPRKVDNPWEPPPQPSVRRIAPVTDVLLDTEALQALRASVGVSMFDEVFEDAIFEVTERLARIEALILRKDYAEIERIAGDLAGRAEQIGLAGVSRIATSLEWCCSASDETTVMAIADRLMRVGEDSLVAVAELSVEIGDMAEGL